MKRDFRKDLEKAAHQMILVHRVQTLSKLILRTIVRNIRVKHAGIFICDRRGEEYIVSVSKGKQGVRIPVGFAKVSKDNPLIRFFTDPLFRIFKQEFLLYDRIDRFLERPPVKQNGPIRRFLGELRDELQLYQARALVPGFFRDQLIGVLFLGEKEDGQNFTRDELGFLSVLASDVVMAIQNAWLFESINEQLSVNKRLFLNTVTALATAIEAKDKYTLGHTERVVKYSLAVARHLKDDAIANQKDFEENLRVAALLHDIGKIGVPEEILGKKAPLIDAEKEFIFKHPIVGSDILNHIAEFSEIILGVKYHHERYDGAGYPFRLKGEEIPLFASIIAVADTYDAMTSDRPYRKALSRETAISEITANSGKQFNPRVVAAFLKVMEEEITAERRVKAPAAGPAPDGSDTDENRETDTLTA